MTELNKITRGYAIIGFTLIAASCYTGMNRMNFISWLLMMAAITAGCAALYYGAYLRAKGRGDIYSRQTGHALYFDGSDPGAAGEYSAYMSVFKQYGHNMKYILNCLLPDGKGSSTEVDMITVGRQGVFVFEVKNYFGPSYGDVNAKYWTEKLGRKEKTFYNPVLQNAGHIRRLKKILPAGVPVYSMVVLGTPPESGCLTGTLPDNTYIKWIADAGKAMKGIGNKNALSKGEVRKVTNIIKAAKLCSEESVRKHIEDVKKWFGDGYNWTEQRKA